MLKEQKTIPLDEIRTNKVALRDVDRLGESFLELRDSVKQYGVRQPIQVRERPGTDGKKYELIDGLQRYTSALEAGTGIPNQFVDRDGQKVGVIQAAVFDEDDAQAMLSQIVSNAVRVETRPAEYSAGLRRILSIYPTWTEAQLAAKLNKTPQWISKQLSLNKLHDQLKPLVDDGKIPVIKAFTLAKLPPEEQLTWAERAMTMSTDEFANSVNDRIKQIKEANRRGEGAGAEVFEPHTHIRKKPEIEDAMKNDSIAKELIRASSEELGIRKVDDAVKGFQLGVAWVLNFDKESQTQQKQAFDERVSRAEDQKKRREEEKKTKRAQEVAERDARVKKEAEDAHAAVMAGAK